MLIPNINMFHLLKAFVDARHLACQQARLPGAARPNEQICALEKMAFWVPTARNRQKPYTIRGLTSYEATQRIIHRRMGPEGRQEATPSGYWVLHCWKLLGCCCPCPSECCCPCHTGCCCPHRPDRRLRESSCQADLHQRHGQRLHLPICCLALPCPCLLEPTCSHSKQCLMQRTPVSGLYPHLVRACRCAALWTTC